MVHRVLCMLAGQAALLPRHAQFLTRGSRQGLTVGFPTISVQPPEPTPCMSIRQPSGSSKTWQELYHSTRSLGTGYIRRSGRLRWDGASGGRSSGKELRDLSV